MLKALARVKTAFMHALAFRSEVFLWLFLDMLPIFVIIAMWVSIYQDKSEIASYNISNITAYYILVLIISSLTSGHFEKYRVEQIRMGKIDYFLTKPFSYIAEVFYAHLGGKLYYFAVSIPFLLTSTLFLSHYYPISIPSFTVSSFLTFALLITFTFLAEFLMGLIIVLAGFWFEGSEGLEHFKWILVSLFSGLMIPMGMMPHWLRSISDQLPFKYMYAFPIEVAIYQKELGSGDYIYLLMFCLFLLIVSKVIWTKAQLQYASAGG